MIRNCLFRGFSHTWAGHPQNHQGRPAYLAALSFLNYSVGTTLLDELDGGPGPTLFIAVTVNV
jgi:hypothetical protein